MALWGYSQGNQPEAINKGRMKMTKDGLKDLLEYCLEKQIPNIWAMIDGKPKWKTIKITKTGKFYRANGVIIGQWFAKDFLKTGLGTFTA